MLNDAIDKALVNYAIATKAPGVGRFLKQRLHTFLITMRKDLVAHETTVYSITVKHDVATITVGADTFTIVK